MKDFELMEISVIFEAPLVKNRKIMINCDNDYTPVILPTISPETVLKNFFGMNDK